MTNDILHNVMMSTQRVACDLHTVVPGRVGGTRR